MARSSYVDSNASRWQCESEHVDFIIRQWAQARAEFADALTRITVDQRIFDSLDEGG